MNIEHISVSRHSLFKECEERYKFKYHLKTPVPGPEPIYFSYGKTLHRIAELYVAGKDPNRWNEIVHDVVSGKIPIQEGKEVINEVTGDVKIEGAQYAPKIDKEYSKKLDKHLKNLREFTMKVGFHHPGYTEYEFKYDLNPPHKYLVTGFIDRIVIKDGKYFILDYKTTKKGPWRKNATTVLSDLQLRLYANVVHKEFGVDPENIHCCLYYLEGGDLVGATYNKKSLQEAEKELLDVYIQIKDLPAEKARGNVGDHCRRCDFKLQCRWRSLTGNIG